MLLHHLAERGLSSKHVRSVRGCVPHVGKGWRTLPEPAGPITSCAYLPILFGRAKKEGQRERSKKTRHPTPYTCTIRIVPGHVIEKFGVRFNLIIVSNGLPCSRLCR
jgi:hypothetical protein